MNGTNASENTFNKLICPVCVAQLNKCSFWKNDVAITSLTSETWSHERKAETVQAKHNSSKYLSVQCEFQKLELLEKGRFSPENASEK